MRYQIRTLAVIATLSVLSAEDRAPLGSYTAAERRHWSFQPRTAPPIPKLANSWANSPIDAFVLARLEKEGMQPSPRADRATLIRRAYFDLLGLPPSPADVDAFIADRSANAWAKLVDRLLANPHYGERWGQHWLDVARYAETDGFEYDTHRNGAWRYRDYVIQSLNNDKPYDKFILEQLAGDEIAPSNDEMRIAAGFQRLGPLRKNAGNQEVASSRNEVLTEMTNAVGSTLLGVTLGCARCHDHKFDPIRQADYYRIQSYFSATVEQDVVRAPAEDQAAWRVKKAEFDDEVKKMKSSLRGLKGEQREAMMKKIEETEERSPEPLPSLYSVVDEPAKATPMHLLARGDYQNKGAAVGMRPLGVLLPDGAPERTTLPENPRTKLAEWVTDPANPLTARVMVNRIWQGHFGRGIVGTPNDFGRMGMRPTHPELLDYLANRFVDGGFRIKPIHRMILLSNAYRQASVSPREALGIEKDPENKLMWKYSRRRLEAEEIRDAMLTVSGSLNAKTGGQGVIVPVDKDLTQFLYKPSQWAVSPDPREHDRRSVYLLAKRNLRLPFMEVFDSPDLQISCPRRESSTHPPQALELLNGDFSNRMAEAFAARLQREAGSSPAKQITLAYRLATGRAPTAVESQLAMKFLSSQPLREFSLAVLNLNRFLYVN